MCIILWKGEGATGTQISKNNPNVSACVDNNKSFQQNILPAVQLVGSHLDFSSSELIVQVSFSDHVLLGVRVSV